MHFADLVVARSIIDCAARPSSASRYNLVQTFVAVVTKKVDGCYSSKFLRSSACCFLLEMFVVSPRHELRIRARRTSTSINNGQLQKAKNQKVIA